MTGNVSRLIKNAAPRRAVTVRTAGADGKMRERTRHVLTMPLKQWTRKMAKGRGPHAKLCQRWLENKGLR